MHGLTGGGWKRKRHRPWLKRKLPAGKPKAGAPRPTAEPFATAPAPDPPRSRSLLFAASVVAWRARSWCRRRHRDQASRVATVWSVVSSRASKSRRISLTVNVISPAGVRLRCRVRWRWPRPGRRGRAWPGWSSGARRSSGGPGAGRGRPVPWRLGRIPRCASAGRRRPPGCAAAPVVGCPACGKRQFAGAAVAPDQQVMAAWAVLGEGDQAQSYQRWPLAPAPADSRCQARFGSRTAISTARRVPIPVSTRWSRETART